MDVFPKNIKLCVFDFDGVLTDNRVYVDETGRESVCCNRSDGLAMSFMKKAGIEVLVLSKETNLVVSKRCEKMKVPCLQAIDDKEVALRAEIEKRKLASEFVAYVGNDVNDLAAYRVAGVKVAVSDAYSELKEKADWILKSRGGEGAAREIASLLGVM